MEDSLKAFCALFRRYMPNFADSIAASQLENKFEVFYYNLTSNTVDLSLYKTLNVLYSELFNEFCSQCCSLIIDHRCSKTLLKRIILTLHHLAWKNIPIRHHFQHSTTLSSSISICLNSFGEEEDQQLFCLCLKVYQLLTYDDNDESYQKFNIDSFNTQDLATHLAGLTCKSSQSTQVQPDDVDSLPPSLAILNNLCKIPKIRSYLASSVKFRDAIIKLLQHSKTSIVIGSLCLLMKLNDRIVCKLLNEKNITDTLHCAFNVLIKGDRYTARLHAADLFIEFLLKSEVTLNAIVNYCNLETGFGAICALLNTLDSREQLCKIVQFLTECFEVDGAVFSPFLCNVFLNESSYFMTLSTLCKSSFDTVADVPDLPYACLRLLTLVLKNSLLQNSNYFTLSECKINVNDLKILIDESLKCPLETSCPFLHQKCSKIYYALELAKVLIQLPDRETRAAIVNTVNPALCRHIFEFQAMSNPLLFSNSNSNSKRELPLWCNSGARIILKIVDFLNCVRKYTAEISEYENVFKSLIEDQATQLVLAYGLSCRKVENVELTLQVLASLSDEKLNKLTAKSLVRKRCIETESNQKSLDNLNSTNLDGLTKNFDDGLNLRIEESQSQIGQIVDTYEKKIIASQTRERQLQEAKTFALQQSDRTLEQYRVAKQEAEKEALKLHALLHGSECKREQVCQELEALKLNLKTQKQLESDLQQSCRDLKSELEASKDAISDYKLKIINMQQVEETYKREIESEKEMHDVLRKHYDTMKQNFKTTSEKLLKVEDELEQSRKQFANSSATIKGLKDKISDLIDKSKVKDENAKTLKEKVQELESEIARKQATIKELERTSAKMKEEIDKHAQIADMIHKLTANK